MLNNVNTIYYYNVQHLDSKFRRFAYIPTGTVARKQPRKNQSNFFGYIEKPMQEKTQN